MVERSQPPSQEEENTYLPLYLTQLANQEPDRLIAILASFNQVVEKSILNIPGTKKILEDVSKKGKSADQKTQLLVSYISMLSKKQLQSITDPTMKTQFKGMDAKQKKQDAETNFERSKEILLKINKNAEEFVSKSSNKKQMIQQQKQLDLTRPTSSVDDTLDESQFQNQSAISSMQQSEDEEDFPLVQMILQKDKEDKTFVFKATQLLAAQSNVPLKAVMQQFKEECEQIYKDSQEKTNPKRLTNLLAIVYSFRKINQEKTKAVGSLQMKQLDGKIETLKKIKKEETKSAEVFERVGKEIQQLEIVKQSIQTSQTNAPIQNEGPSIGGVTDRTREVVLKNPDMVQKFYNALETRYKDTKNPNILKLKNSVQMKLAKIKKNAEIAQQNLEEVKVAPGQNHNAAESMASQVSQQVAIRKTNFDINSVLLEPGVTEFIQSMSQQFQLDTGQKPLLFSASQNLDIADLMQNYQFIQQQKSTDRVKKLLIQAMEDGRVKAILDDIRLNNPKQQIPDDPKQIILEDSGNIGASKSLKMQPIVRQRKPTQKQMMSKKFIQENPLILGDEKMMQGARLKAQEQSSEGQEAKFVVTLYDYLEYIAKSAHFVSMINGEIGEDTLLEKYKTRTTVFTDKIQKLENNEFKITQGAAFKVRPCC